MVDIALYGGGFDPITLAHEEVIKAVSDWTGFKVWIMPCHSHKFDKKMAPPWQRLEMVRLLAKEINQVPFDFEVYRELNGTTYDTLDLLDQLYTGLRFHVVMGMDNANIVETKWANGSLLIQEYPCIVVGRKSTPITANWFFKEPHKYIEPGIDGSATEFRDLCEAGDFAEAEKKVHPLVWSYILANNLYGVAL